MHLQNIRIYCRQLDQWFKVTFMLWFLLRIKEVLYTSMLHSWILYEMLRAASHTHTHSNFVWIALSLCCFTASKLQTKTYAIKVFEFPTICAIHSIRCDHCVCASNSSEDNLEVVFSLSLLFVRKNETFSVFVCVFVFICSFHLLKSFK